MAVGSNLFGNGGGGGSNLFGNGGGGGGGGTMVVAAVAFGLVSHVTHRGTRGPAPCQHGHGFVGRSQYVAILIRSNVT